MTLKGTISITLIAAVMLFSGCTSRKGTDVAEKWQQYGTAEAPKTGLVIPVSEKGSAGNQAIAEVIKNASAELEAEYRILNPGDLANDRESLVYLAENNFKLIVTTGKAIEKELNSVAKVYPDIRFALIGGELDQPNVSSIRFEKSEGAFLAGVLAGSLSKSGIVGFIGGAPGSDQDILNGFSKGVQYLNLILGKKVKVNSIFAGVTAQASDNVQRGEELANTLILAGSDVVFVAPGKMANGAVKGAIQNKKIAITNDKQLLTQYPWNVYGAVLDKAETAVYDMVKKALTGKLQGGRSAYGVAEGAVDIVLSEAVPEETKTIIIAAKDRIKKGELKPYLIQVPKDMVSEVNQLPVDWNKQQNQNILPEQSR